MNNKTVPDSNYYNPKTKVEGDNISNNNTVAYNLNEQVKHREIENLSPIVGFLVSYSKTECGEFWPIREGNKNSIGYSNDSMIQLMEATVSQSHALINARRSRNDNRLMITISDVNSRNGILVNGKDIEAQTHECNCFDVITIGNYELLLLVADKVKFNLIQKSNFQEFFDYSSRKLY